MNRQEILAALREKRITPDEARALLRGEATAPGPAATPAPGPAPTSGAAPGAAAGDLSPIAVVGMSGRYATAENLDQYWELLDEGRDAVREIPPHRWDMDRYYDPTVGKEGTIYCRWMGLLDDIDSFDSHFFEISPAEAEMMDPQHRLFLEEAYRAFEDAGYPRKRLDGSNCGVYLGLASSDYYTLCHATAHASDAEELPSVTSVSNAIAAGRLAYYLNLKGPALTVDTACSSSLVSVHLGVEALRRGEVDMALAAGVSLYLSPDSYMHMCAAGMLSPDGRCKSFDNGANGFVPGEGAGAVVLKRLADAERDGDQIHGVIIASGINQDGRTNGITAPNLGSQIELVRAAYARHDIDPATISYAELHGTGTKLGDPIELEALATAFRDRTELRQYCAIGSVKSNVGHMSAAAGVAGLHKILLSMRHRRLAPTLHVQSPNEHFDFEGSPFVVNTEGRAWEPAAGAPRRAALSAFGFSGTNAHVVVDEYHPAPAARPVGPEDGRRARDFLLSAKAEPQLRAYARRLADHLVAHPELDLDDVAYTTQLGREAMRERLAVTATDREQLVEALDRFARLGETGPGVRRGRAARRPTGDDWVEGGAVDWAAGWAGRAPRRISLPTYPFEKQHHWYPAPFGDAPQRAAEPAAEASGRAVPHPLVHENVSDFTRQRFRSVFTGREFFLADHRVAGRPVLPGAAVLELARAAGALSAGQPVTAIDDVVWSRPVADPTVEISLLPGADGGASFEVTDGAGEPCASGRLGFAPAAPPAPLDVAVLRARCATRLDHAALYAGQPAEPEAESEGVCYGRSFRTLRELAHGATEALATLELAEPAAGEAEFTLHPALLDGAWQALGPLLAGTGQTHLPFAVRRVSCFGPLPSPALAHVRQAGAGAGGSRSFDITIADQHGAVAAEITGFTVRPLAAAERPEPVFLTRRWAETPALLTAAGRGRTLLLLADDEAADLVAGLAAEIEVTVGTEYTVDAGGTRFTVRPTERDDHARVLAELRRRDRLPERIVLVETDPTDGPHAVHALAGAITSAAPRWPVDLLYVYPVAGRAPRPEQLAVGGYLRALVQEDRRVTARTVGVTIGADVADLLRQECAVDPAEASDVWWRDRVRQVATTVDATEEPGAAGDQAGAPAGDGPAFREGGVYLITGALSGVGLLLAHHLAASYRARLVLAARREPTGVELPDGETLVVRADVSRRSDVDALVARARERFGRIDGVIHSAGVLRDGLVRNKSAADLAAVLAPKVAGTRHLDEALADEPLDFFVVFSSMSAVLGNVGQADYCYANAFQDAFAADRERRRQAGTRSGRTLSVGWPFWAEGGMTLQPEARTQLRERLGIAPLATAEGWQALERALLLPATHVVYASGEAATIRRVFGAADVPADVPAGTPASSAPTAVPAPVVAAGSGVALRSAVVAYLTRVISERTKSDAGKIDSGDEFETFGIDSIMMMSLTRRMEEDFGELPKTLFFEYASIDELADHLVRERADDVRRLFAPAAPVVSAPMVAAGSGVALRSAVVAYLTRVISERTKSDAGKIDSGDEFETFGIDSIMMMSLTRRMEEDFGELPKTLFFEYASIDELADHLVRERADDVRRLFAPAISATPATPAVPALPATPASRFRPAAAQVTTPAVRATETARATGAAGRATGDIAVIGISGRYPEADDLQEFWENLVAGRDAVREVPRERWDHAEYYEPGGRNPGKAYAKWGGFLRDVDRFDPLFFSIPPSEADFLDPQARLFLQSAWHAVEDAGYTRAALADRTVGVYVGVMYGMYQLFEGEIRGEPAPVASSFAAIANRVSYFMNLRGPSMAIDTMCSSSLTSIHLGCESIRRGESDMVIAGGVNLTIHPNKLILLSQGNFAASDGRCRSFGEGGDGYVPGEGVGAVLLKSLDQALADGDHVHAVIKGTAINAGGKTTGFTVPNPNAQADLIRAGLADAGVDARTVSYVEAHGTGTSLGDPIEVTALTNAFRAHTDETGYCAIGSVKSNIGHLESAAGIAALTKVVLQLKHRQLVPSLHATTLNPFIDFDRSPFAVQRELADWAAPAGQPRRAGISSFGAGGANAHLVVEEFTGRPVATGAPAGPLLFVYSARDEDRLRELVGRHLAAARRAFDGADLTAVARTLQLGREAMEARLAVVADGLDELVSRLAGYLAGEPAGPRVFTGDSRGVRRQSKLLVGLIEDSDMTAGLLRERRLEKAAELWVEGLALDWTLLYGDRLPDRVPLPGYAFARERHWVSGPARFGTPRAAGAEVLHPLLHRNSSTLAGLRFSATFTGREFFLADHQVGGRRLLPAVAYLEMALAAVRAALPEQAAGLTLRVEDVVWLRPFTLDGEGQRTAHLTLTPGSAGDLVGFRVHSDDAGELTHCQGSVRLVAAAEPEPETLDLAGLRARYDRPGVEGEWLYRTFARMGIDYGPAHQVIERVHRGRDEALVALRLPGDATVEPFTLHPALLDAALQAALPLALPDDLDALPETEATEAELPFAVGAVEVTGALTPVMWARLRRITGDGERLRKIDVTLADQGGRVVARLDQVAFKSYQFDTADEPAAERLLFTPRWQAGELAGDTPAAPLDRWLVLLAEPAGGLLGGLAERLPEADCQPLTPAAAGLGPAELGARYQEMAVDLLARIAELLREHRGQRLLVQVVAADPAAVALAGLLRTAHSEHPSLSVQFVGVQDGPPADTLAERLRAERAWPVEQLVRYPADGRREVCAWAALPAPTAPAAPLWRDGGVYLVTGGAAGLGLVVAEEIARTVAEPRLVLTGRSAAGPASEAAVARLRALGALAEYVATDVTDPAACRALVAHIRAEHGALHGVTHCAGITRDRLLTAKTADEARAVLAPKTVGVVALDEATADQPLEFFLLFSSVAGALGNIGQADYAAGNAFLDHFATHRAALMAAGERRGRTLSVNWQLWRDGGMGLTAEQARAATDAAGLAVLTRETGLAVLADCVATGAGHVLPLVGDAEKLRGYLRGQTANTPAPPASAPTPAVAAGTEDEQADRDELLAEALKEVVAEEIRLDAGRIDAHVPLENYGIDSVLVINLTQLLERDFGTLSKTIFFENQTVMELAHALGRSHPTQVAELLARRAGTTAPPTPAPAAVQFQPQPQAPAVEPAPTGWSPLWATDRPTAPATPRALDDQDATAGLDIAIVGVAGRYPRSADLAAFWTNLRQGVDCVTEIPTDRWDHSPYLSTEAGQGSYARWGGFLDDAAGFDSLFFNISPGEAEILDPQERIFLECVHHTLEDAGYSRRALTGRPVGVYVGVMYEEYQLYAAQLQLRGEHTTLNGSAASIANRVSYHYGLHGPSLAVDTMCSSSLVAIHLAAQSLRDGECEVAIAGGVNLHTHPNKFLMLGRNHFASTKGRCESFGSGGDGYVPGEGVGAVLLKPLARAEADGDHIHGVIKGTAVSHDGKTNGYTVPNPHAQTAVIRRALERAGVDAGEVSYVEAHGTGTRLGDPIEVSALTRAFGERATEARGCYLGSAKSNIGHCESAAGIAGISKVLLQLRHGEIVPSLHSAELNPEIDFPATPFTVPQEVLPWEAPAGGRRIAGISSFGAGGTNAHVVIAEYQPATAAAPASGPVLVPLSARRPDQLRAVAGLLADWLAERQLTDAELADLGYTLQVGRDAFEERLGFVVHSAAELAAGLADFLAGRPVRHTGRVGTPVPPPRGRGAEEHRASYAARDFDALLQLWVGGQDLDWEALTAGEARRRIGLPAYPFDRRRHWLPAWDTATPLAAPARGGPTAPAAPRLHPLLHQNHSSLFAQRFTATFTGAEPFLDGHRVGGRKVLPGAVTLEMARLAGALSLEQEVRALRDVLWLQPIEVADQPVEVTVWLLPEDDALLVRIGVDEGPPEARVRMEARIDLETEAPAAPAPVDLPGVIAGCDRKLSGAAGYAGMAAVGLDNGPAFQVIEEVLVGEGQAVAHLALPAGTERHPADVLSPALVNGAFQAVSALMTGAVEPAGPGRLLLPFSVGGLDVRAPLPEECVAHLRRSGGAQRAGRGTVDRFDITLTDLTGNVLVVVRDYALKSFATGAENR
ncbi:SDR family NAD(P)-dependent oxidoreductase [Streptomyces sp. DSM 44915]|uniref:SDR family NAD(P)-dependent oxidoreductase n=1 Tax=Streptomyces chisholmiae TaxID=3075540 RepID=A0ABU2JTN3_9ACTN|nr:SDR family NAD(P)-dependent oxidoreductase [Streptomyces sp. DSM 44915]MDT0268346.1 SDR family NAD(P)-dependent oxidoreductase [Streptomyces sp. DSM 44915]UZD11008.1 polyketide synthase [Marinispora sp. CNQ-140]